MEFAVHAQNHGDFVTLRCSGRLVFDQGTIALREAVLAQASRRLLLDLGDTHSIDAAGVGTLIALHQHVCSNGGRLVIVRPSARVLHVLRITKVERLLEVQRPQHNLVRAYFAKAAAPMGDTCGM
jgi:anti-anti-sigma factor